MFQNHILMIVNLKPMFELKPITEIYKSKVRNPSETDSIKSQISSKTSGGKKDSTKDAIKEPPATAR